MTSSRHGLALAYVTTAWRARPELVARAEKVAARCGIEYVPSAPRKPDDAIAYVVGNHRDELRGRGASLTVHAGLLAARRHAGRAHPLLRAVAPDRVDSVWDATCGLGADSLHFATALDARVVASEGAPAVVCLIEEGLARLSRAPVTRAAGRIELRAGLAEELLPRAPDSVDVVYLDPMFPAPRRGAPGFELLRHVARAEPLGPAVLAAARRAARRRVVLKLPPEAEPPSGFTHRARGRAASYAVCELGRARPL